VDALNGNYRLQQDPCQSGVTNPCVDTGDPNASMIAGTTRTDWVQDAGRVDMGSHYAIPPATAKWYCGTGANAATDGFVITGPPILGGTLSASITGCAPGNWAAFLVAYSAPLTFPSPWGEVLVDIGHPGGELFGMPSGIGTPTVIDVPMPSDPSSCGFVFYTQAVSFVGPLCLHCAYECTIGL